MLRLEARPTPSRTMTLAAPLLALAMTILTGALLFAGLGHAPGPALYHFFIGPLSDRYGLAELGVKAAPLVLIALGLSLGFRAGIWNIGAEGQLIAGAICGGGFALAVYPAEGPWVLPLMLFAAAAGGMAWAALPALLRVWRNTNEILTSLMLVYVASLLLRLLMNGVLRDPDGFSFPESRLLPDGTLLPIILAETRLHLGAILALAAALAVWVLARHTLVGFQIKVAGLAPNAARYAGFNHNRLIWLTFMISGGLAGLAGVGEVAGPMGQLVPEVSPGYGFTAIIVAFLGRLHPAGIVLAGLVVALSYLGGENAQINAGLPLAVTGVFQGLLLFFLLACDVLIQYKPRLNGPRWRSKR